MVNCTFKYFKMFLNVGEQMDLYFFKVAIVGGEFILQFTDSFYEIGQEFTSSQVLKLPFFKDIPILTFIFDCKFQVTEHFIY